MINEFETPHQYRNHTHWEDSCPTFLSESDIKLINISYNLKAWVPALSASVDNRFRTDGEISDSIYRIMKSKKR